MVIFTIFFSYTFSGSQQLYRGPRIRQKEPFEYLGIWRHYRRRGPRIRRPTSSCLIIFVCFNALPFHEFFSFRENLKRCIFTIFFSQKKKENNTRNLQCVQEISRKRKCKQEMIKKSNNYYDVHHNNNSKQVHTTPIIFEIIGQS